MEIILISIAILFVAKYALTKKQSAAVIEQTYSPNFTQITIISVQELFSALIESGLTTKGAYLAVAHALVEGKIPDENAVRTRGFNFWNFGLPSWYRARHPSSENTEWGLATRADEVGKTLSFVSLELAIKAYLELLLVNKPDGITYAILHQDEPDIELWLSWICEPAERWSASHCPDGTYQNSIRYYYSMLLEHGVL